MIKFLAMVLYKMIPKPRLKLWKGVYMALLVFDIDIETKVI